MAKIHPRRGEIWYANLDPVQGSEQGGHRPVVVLQNNIANKFSPVSIVAIMTRQGSYKDERRPDFVRIEENSYVMCNQVRTLDKSRFDKIINTIPPDIMTAIDNAIHNSMGLRLCHKCTAPIEKDWTECKWCKEIVQWQCPDCSKLISVHFQFCPYCGQPYLCPICNAVVSVTKEQCDCGMILINQCIGCKEKYDSNFNFCPYCGHKKEGGCID